MSDLTEGTRVQFETNHDHDSGSRAGETAAPCRVGTVVRGPHQVEARPPINRHARVTVEDERGTEHVVAPRDIEPVD